VDYQKVQKSLLKLPEPFKSAQHWIAFRDEFTNYLHSIKGAKGVSLFYIVRPATLPRGANPMDPIYSTDHDAGNAQYLSDRGVVYTALMKCTLGGPGQTYVLKHKSNRNGRQAFLALDEIFAGDAVTSTKMEFAWQAIRDTKYNGKRKNFDFSAYKGVMDKAFRELEEAGNPQPDATKVSFLVRCIESESLKRIVDGVVTDPLLYKNYHEATLYIARCIAHDRAIDTETKQSRSLMPVSTSTLSTRNYSPEEWKQLSKDQKTND